MAINVREETIEEIEEKLKEMQTALNKINYLESALKISGFSFEIKRFLWGELARLYEERKMYEKAARAMMNKAAVEVTSKEKVDSYIYAAELYSKLGKVDDADDMFVRAGRDANNEQKARVRLARKNIYFECARELESEGKRAGVVKFYEKLIKMKLDDVEKAMIKDKLIKIYTSLGMFREARLVEGI